MAQPKKPPLSIRASDELLAKIDGYATDNGLTRHAATLELIEKGLCSLAQPVRTSAVKPQKPQPPPIVQPKAVHVSAPFAGDVQRKPYQKGTKK